MTVPGAPLAVRKTAGPRSSIPPFPRSTSPPRQRFDKKAMSEQRDEGRFAEGRMKYDKDMHHPRRFDVVTLDAGGNVADGSVPRWRPRRTLLCWGLLGAIPWIVIAILLYR
ncbi:hypothetical protein QLH51_17845 [Sphingomonas sp. 2R-10]|uniref:hypothetical protein n=1 Tax=Sphingomonas sp. 2R-10 TaxID=3045148 RepID=UPI000F78D57C|nr:hypothetical protein [Sphingomonas sp. 2R-10]MDJ0278659.1 hypothetical protein [Sphingomonas sp. 2R-10]